MSDESEAIHGELMDHWDRHIRPFLVDTGSGHWRYTGPSQQAGHVAAGVLRLEELAEAGDPDAAEGLAEYLALDGPAHDAARAYKWYYVVLSHQGYTVTFEDQNGTPPHYCGPVGDFRNESMVSGLVSELGFERVQELDREAAEWVLRRNPHTAGEG